VKFTVVVEVERRQVKEAEFVDERRIHLGIDLEDGDVCPESGESFECTPESLAGTTSRACKACQCRPGCLFESVVIIELVKLWKRHGNVRQLQ
jgi:hypothetical protein